MKKSTGYYNEKMKNYLETLFNVTLTIIAGLVLVAAIALSTIL